MLPVAFHRSICRLLVRLLVVLCGTLATLSFAHGQEAPEPDTQGGAEVQSSPGAPDQEAPYDGLRPEADRRELRFKESNQDGSETSYGSYILLLVVLIAMVAAIVYLRQRSDGFVGRGSGRIVVGERRRLSMQTYATILSVDGKEYLVVDNGRAVSWLPLPSKDEG